MVSKKLSGVCWPCISSIGICLPNRNARIANLLHYQDGENLSIVIIVSTLHSRRTSVGEVSKIMTCRQCSSLGMHGGNAMPLSEQVNFREPNHTQCRAYTQG